MKCKSSLPWQAGVVGWISFILIYQPCLSRSSGITRFGSMWSSGWFGGLGSLIIEEEANYTMVTTVYEIPFTQVLFSCVTFFMSYITYTPTIHMWSMMHHPHLFRQASRTGSLSRSVNVRAQRPESGLVTGIVSILTEGLRFAGVGKNNFEQLVSSERLAKQRPRPRSGDLREISRRISRDFTRNAYIITGCVQLCMGTYYDSYIGNWSVWF